MSVTVSNIDADDSSGVLTLSIWLHGSVWEAHFTKWQGLMQVPHAAVGLFIKGLEPVTQTQVNEAYDSYRAAMMCLHSGVRQDDFERGVIAERYLKDHAVIAGAATQVVSAAFSVCGLDKGAWQGNDPYFRHFDIHECVDSTFPHLRRNAG